MTGLLTMVGAFGTALAAPPECAPPVTPASAIQVGVETRGRKVGGLGIAAMEGEAWSLTLLAPAGFELFTVSGPPTTVATGLDAWRPWLERLPVERDLRVIFAPVAEGTCRAEHGRIRTRLTAEGWERRWCGKGGAVTAKREGGRVVLDDRRRGYTLTMVVDAPTAEAAPQGREGAGDAPR